MRAFLFVKVVDTKKRKPSEEKLYTLQRETYEKAEILRKALRRRKNFAFCEDINTCLKEKSTVEVDPKKS